ncbi:uncharacterized protein [Diadema antillarum]|uniref:uncharacterized protein n=1 Tax=Diadema antillarum TaxID=105358 RepID=UPI003A852F97
MSSSTNLPPPAWALGENQSSVMIGYDRDCAMRRDKLAEPWNEFVVPRLQSYAPAPYKNDDLPPPPSPDQPYGDDAPLPPPPPELTQGMGSGYPPKSPPTMQTYNEPHPAVQPGYRQPSYRQPSSLAAAPSARAPAQAPAPAPAPALAPAPAGPTGPDWSYHVPKPTDQPISAPAKSGAEAEIDALTNLLVANMGSMGETEGEFFGESYVQSLFSIYNKLLLLLTPLYSERL